MALLRRTSARFQDATSEPLASFATSEQKRIDYGIPGGASDRNLTALINWVERGEPPAMLMAAHVPQGRLAHAAASGCALLGRGQHG